MPDSAILPPPLDEIDRDAAGAGNIHLERAAAHLAIAQRAIEDARHEAELAAACSDLCECPEAIERITDAGSLLTDAALRLSVKHGANKARIATEAARAKATGIHARRKLNSPCYDHLFQIVNDPHYGCICVMVPGTRAYDPDYFELVKGDCA